MQQQVATLGDLWRQRHEARARGGERALAGFHYQALVALRDILRAYVAAPAAEPPIAVEQLSDIVEIGATHVVFTQVKRTGHTVAGALEEFWSIETVAQEEIPALESQLRYRILCSEWTLKDVEAAVRAWRPVEGAQNETLASFKAKVDWQAEPSPLTEVVALFVNEFDAEEPLTEAMASLARLFEPRTGVRTIWAQLHALHGKREAAARNRLYVWQPSDQPPSVVERGPILTGVRPRIEHLRRGYFANRALYDELEHRALAWLSHKPWADDPAMRIPVLWLSGRSGAGKSIALLHLLASLEREQVGQIVWLGSGEDLLPEGIRRAGDIGSGPDVILAMDDPYIPRAQGGAAWREALRNAEQLENREIEPPVILCCGPPEHARQIKRDFSDQVFVEVVPLPDEVSDRPALARWFTERTGAEPPALGQGDVLPVQLFFEWRAGEPITSFAHSFRRRVESQDEVGDVLSTVFRIVSVNRLYVGYPEEALASRLSPAQRDLFQTLLDEHHFAIDEDPGRPGVWLTHPHLASALFDAWLPVDYGLHERHAIFRDATLDVLRYARTARDQTAPLWGFRAIMRAEQPYRQRALGDQPQRFFPELYARWREASGGRIDRDHLPAWLAVRLAVPDLRLDPDPVDEALGELEAPRPTAVSQLLWHLVLESWDRLDKAQHQRVRRLLLKLARTPAPSHDEAVVILDALRHWSSSELRRAFRTSLAKNNPASFAALSWILTQRWLGSSREWFLDVTVEWVRDHVQEQRTGRTIRNLLVRRDLAGLRIPLATLALDWLDHADPSADVDHVLRRLIVMPTTRGIRLGALRLGFDHLERTGLRSESSFLIVAILRATQDAAIAPAMYRGEHVAQRAVRVATEWIERFPTDRGRKYVRDLLLQAPRLPDSAWIGEAKVALAGLAGESNPHEALFTLLSLTRRIRLLDDGDRELFDTRVRQWLRATEEMIDRESSLDRFRTLANIRASALPLAAHLGDAPLEHRIIELARGFREGADPRNRSDFDRILWAMLNGDHWPDETRGRVVLRELGLERADEDLYRELESVLAGGSTDSLATLVEAATNRARALLSEGDVASCGFLLAKVLPAAARVDDETLEHVEALVAEYVAGRLPPRTRMGFLRECDIWIERSGWPEGVNPYEVFDRVELVTPRFLSSRVEAGETIAWERLDAALRFADEVVRSNQPLRGGLFIAPATVLALRIDDEELKRVAVAVTRRFVASPQIDELHKIILARELWRLADSSCSDELLPIAREFALYAPWLEAEAKTGQADVELLREALTTATDLAAGRGTRRAGTFLAPVLAASSGLDDAIFQDAFDLARKLMPGYTHPQRLAFLKACRSQRWPSKDSRDAVLDALELASAAR